MLAPQQFLNKTQIGFRFNNSLRRNPQEYIKLFRFKERSNKALRTKPKLTITTKSANLYYQSTPSVLSSSLVI
ncbi:MAG: hypothetical protein ACK44U_03620, partial [Sphingobacteriales bacterium]